MTSRASQEFHKRLIRRDTTDFINFIEKTKVNKQTFLVSMDVTNLYTNIPQEEGITTECRAYENFNRNNPRSYPHTISQRNAKPDT